MNKRLVSLRRFSTVALFVVLSATSCQKDSTETNIVLGQGDTIMFNVSSDGSMDTRSENNESSAVKSLSRTSLDVGEEPLFLTMTEARNTDLPINTAAATRGIDYSTGNDVTSFRVTALQGSGDTYFEDLVVSDKTNNVFNTGKFWPNAGSLDFFAYAISKGNIEPKPTFSNSDEYTGEFSYSLPAPATTNPTDAENQPDIIFAANADEVKQETAVPLVFHHALSAISFKVGRMPKNVTINSISLNDVISKGECSFEYDDTETDESIRFSWSYDTTPKTESYTQTFDKNISNPETATDAEKTISTDETTFMMIPQELSDDVELEINFTVDDNNYTLTKQLNEIISEWQADHKYTFVISTLDEISIDVEDNVVGNIKNNLTITNTGFNDGYVRATIIGFWKNSNGDAVMPWNAPANISVPSSATDDGVFQLPSNWSNNWMVGGDGFYYYKHLLDSQHSTAKLFESYTLNAAPPVAGAELELSIIVQIVAEKDITNSGWPVSAANQTLSIK